MQEQKYTKPAAKQALLTAYQNYFVFENMVTKLRGGARGGQREPWLPLIF
jgi:hypothetical protein